MSPRGLTLHQRRLLAQIAAAEKKQTPWVIDASSGDVTTEIWQSTAGAKSDAVADLVKRGLLEAGARLVLVHGLVRTPKCKRLQAEGV